MYPPPPPGRPFLVLRVKSRLLSPLTVIARAVEYRRSTTPVYRHFVKSNTPQVNELAVKSALNPRYVPGIGVPGFQLTDALASLHSLLCSF